MSENQGETCVLIRWTVLMPTWCNAAVFRTLTPRVERAPDRGCYSFLNWRPAEPLSLGPSPCKPGACPLANHRGLEFRKDSQHLEQRPARWRRCVERLLVQEQIDIGGLQLAQKCNEVL